DGAEAPTDPKSNGRGPSAAPATEPSPIADSAPSTQSDPEPSPNGGAADPAEAERATPPATDADGRPPLPKRTPQTNLAPQLYETPSAPAFGTASQQEEDDEDRSARLRHNMSAFQQGTRRGRTEGQLRQNDTDKDS
ncbi:histidine kinase, partial [Streptomonospora algeriensis]